MKLARNSVISLCFIFIFTNVLLAQNRPEYDSKEWHRKQNRELFALMDLGETDKAISEMEKMLEKLPNDQEILFGLSLAWWNKGKTKKANELASLAIQNGLPIKRYLAGPRKYTQPLVESKPFQKNFSDGITQLVHGPMLGDFSASEAKIWIRTFQEVPFRVIYSQKENMQNPVFSGTFNTNKNEDYTGIAILKDLSSNQKYYYQLEIDGKKMDEIHHFQTFPKSLNDQEISIAFGGGAAYNPELENMWNTIQQKNPDALLLLGDNVYIDKPEQPNTQQYCYYRRQNSQPFGDLISKVPVYTIWDDHDFGVDDCFGGPEIDAPAWKKPVWKIFKENWNNPAYQGGENPGCYYNYSIGEIEFFMLDCRYYREAPGGNDDNYQPSMLGPVQKKWLLESLGKSTAKVKVIVSSVPMAAGIKGPAKDGTFDTWDGYAAEREEIFNHLTTEKIKGVIILSADRHRSDAYKINRTGDYALYEFSSSRLTNIHVHELIPHSLFGYNEKCSFGLVKFDLSEEMPLIEYQIYDIEGKKHGGITISGDMIGY
ncbi:alkaline phosphatase D family protein [Flexithrix dorotheae]|uniref:alkaline phosphatase D family protein n=1 Tax=Flexithrix dorotheae TaxID=70993 RepID=UPI00037E18AF|nr:alkaline phosphatase D family protein [Flexithrix dorotheae]